MPENEGGAAASADDGAAVAVAVAPPPGKHRISAELKRLEQEARFLEKELEEVEKTEKVSAALQEFLFKVESKPDPLLPVYSLPPIRPSTRKKIFVLILLFPVVAELTDPRTRPGTGGLKDLRICADANAGLYNHLCKNFLDMHRRSC